VMAPFKHGVLVYSYGDLYDLYEPEMSWAATSGPWGNGEAPSGMYQILSCYEWAEPHPSYTDGKGLCWFAKIEPCFETTRSGFGIHPDGGVEGTEGCIGLTDDDTRECFEHVCGMLDAPAYLIVL